MGLKKKCVKALFTESFFQHLLGWGPYCSVLKCHLYLQMKYEEFYAEIVEETEEFPRK